MSRSVVNGVAAVKARAKRLTEETATQKKALFELRAADGRLKDENHALDAALLASGNDVHELMLRVAHAKLHLSALHERKAAAERDVSAAQHQMRGDDVALRAVETCRAKVEAAHVQQRVQSKLILEKVGRRDAVLAQQGRADAARELQLAEADAEADARAAELVVQRETFLLLQNEVSNAVGVDPIGAHSPPRL
jgi:hypothetical protein